MMITITSDILLKIMPLAGDRAREFAKPINVAMQRGQINNRKRAAMFLATIAHECLQLKRLQENLNYSKEALIQKWPHRFTEKQAEECARKPILIANRAYANRFGNGNIESGDGWKFRGRGLIHLTFQGNYLLYEQRLKLPLIDNPDLLMIPEHAANASAEFWIVNRLNKLADASDFSGLTKVVQGGLDGLDKREVFLMRALAVLPPDPVSI